MPEARQPMGVADLRRNRLLATLPAADQERLASGASTMRFRRGATVFEAGSELDAAFFPCDGALLSLGVPLSSDRSVETAIVGAEGVAGARLGGEGRPAFGRAAVRADGDLVRIEAHVLRGALAASPSLCDVFARYADCFIAELLQNVACTMSHSLDKRMARWLLCFHDRLRDRGLQMTHDELARLLGVGRTYVTRAASALRARGHIRYCRGNIAIADREGLAAAACGCRDAVAAHFARVLPGVYPADHQGSSAAA